MRVFVRGAPVPQGSMSAVNGHVFHSNGSALRSWRGAIVDAIIKQHPKLEMLDAEVYVWLIFFLPHPKTVKRASPTVKPDIDKLARAVLDALVEAKVMRDDAQVIFLSAAKYYAVEVEPGVSIKVEAVEAV